MDGLPRNMRRRVVPPTHCPSHWAPLGSLAAHEPKPGGIIITGMDFHTVASFSHAKTKRERIPLEFSIFPLNRSINLSPCPVEDTFKDIKSPVWEPRRRAFPSRKSKNLCLKCILIGTWTWILTLTYIRNSLMYNTIHMEMQLHVNKSESRSDLIPTTTSLYR